MKYQHRVLGMLSLLAVITYLDRVCIAVAGPRMQEALHIGPEAWGWVTSVFFLAYSAFEMPTGALGDRIGPRRVLTRVVAWWSAFTTLTGTVSNYYVLLLVRFCFGAGEAGAYPNASAVIGRWIPAAKRTRAWGIVSDDQSGRRRLVAAAGRTDSSALRLAGALLRVRRPRRGVERGLVRRGFGIRRRRKPASPRPNAAKSVRSRPATPRHALGDGVAHPGVWRIAGICACYSMRWDFSSRGCKRIW